jgi:hypothetical protein
MFPTPYRPPNPFQPRSRPISPFDNAATTGLLSNPNGTYVANPFPTTAQNGQQGAYGAMLPQVQVNTPRVSGLPPIVPMVGYIPPVAVTPGPTAFTPANPNAQTPDWYNRIGAPAANPAGPASNPDYRTRGYTSRGTEAVTTGGSSVIDNYNYIRNTGQINEGMIKLLIQKGGPESAEYKALSPAQREAVDRIVNKSGGAGGTPGAGQFYGYERNPETGRSERVIKDSSTSNFSKELRWDPDRKKYVEIGKLMKEGKLDKYGGWHKKKKGGGGGGGGRSSAPPGKKAQWTGSYGVVNFNTGTG